MGNTLECCTEARHPNESKLRPINYDRNRNHINKSKDKHSGRQMSIMSTNDKSF